jgi:phage repressor protein C with HTH and peptisase S24 domain
MYKENIKKIVQWLILQGRVESQRDLAAQLGYQESSFSQIVNGHVPVSNKFLSRLCGIDPRINRDWIVTGQGDMLNDGAPVIDVTPVDDERAVFYSENAKGAKFYKRGDQLYMSVRHVPYACFGQFANESDRLDPVNDDWAWETYEVDRVAKGHYHSCEVKGDSMDTGERNSFEAGDRVLVRELERPYWRDTIRFHERPYWVVVFGSSVLIKQLIAQDEQKGTLTFHSLNPSPEYADFTLNENDIRALYYVIKKKPREITF